MFIGGVNDTGDKLLGGVTAINFSAVSTTPAIRESCLSK
jgi:hypothetical protein